MDPGDGRARINSRHAIPVVPTGLVCVTRVEVKGKGQPVRRELSHFSSFSQKDQKNGASGGREGLYVLR